MTLSEALMSATVSSCGLEVRIDCNDHDIKDAIFNGLEALAARQDGVSPRMDREEWQPIKDLPWSLLGCPDHILLWNPCDGPHLLWCIHSWGEIQSARYGKVYTHWKPFTDRPQVSDDEQTGAARQDGVREATIEECAIVAESYKADDPETVRMISYRVEIANRIRALSGPEQGETQ